LKLHKLMYPRRQPLVFCIAPLLVLFSLSGSVVVGQDEMAGSDSLDAISQRVLAAVGTPRPATGIDAKDNPNDGGGTISVNWTLSSDDSGTGPVIGYQVLRSELFDGPFEEIGTAVAGASVFEDGNTTDGQEYYYKIITLASIVVDDGPPMELSSESETIGPVSSSAQWFDWRRINVLVMVLLVAFFIVYFIQRAKAGQKLFIRKIAGMDAVDEAVGRATEMGRKIFYVPGINDMDNVQTIASMTILGRVAE